MAKGYGGRAVLADLSLEVRRGEALALVGVNGAGKTTCVKALLDFCAIDRGDIEIFGIPHHQTRSRGALAYLPERFLPPYYLTGRDFLVYMARLHGGRYQDAGARAVLQRLAMDADVLDRPVRQYSKGMAQKLGLAAVLLSGRELLVLDEPMSGLDPQARASVRERLVDLKAHGRTLFFTTHLLSDVENLCDRLAVIHDARLCYVGTPRACLEQFRAETLEAAYLACIGS